mmetsp:Transcript_118076/g.329143  ORF Transcript_118076/g.329143 Transcript_118076/m.329143 type:complete len:574 (+) Transcript_118076:81-1802(+)
MAAGSQWRQQSGRLSIELEDHTLLRATSLATVLHSFGAHFRAASLAGWQFTQEEADRLYANSRHTASIKYFLSHAWQDGRLEKWLTLCLHFNLPGAMLLSSLVVVIVRIPGAIGILPLTTIELCDEEEVHYAPWCYTFGLLSYLGCVHFWHYMPQWLLGHRGSTVFMDKLCIHQADVTRKQAGILAFAAFIAKSKYVCCLWSPEYFTRLWCTLEMAAMTTSSNQAALPMVFLPVKLYKMAYCLFLFVALGRMLYAINNVTGRVLPAASFMGLMCIILAPLLLTNSVRQYYRDRMELEKQLQVFSVDDAACCFEDDRAVIYEALREWFGDTHTFDELVRTQVRAHIIEAIGSKVHVPLAVNIPIMLLQVFYYIDFAGSHCYGFRTWDVNAFNLLQDLAWLFCVGSVLPMQLRLASCLPAFRWRLPDMAATAVLALGGGLAVAGQFVAIFVVMEEFEVVWQMLFVTLLCALWFAWLQRESFRSSSTQQATSKPGTIGHATAVADPPAHGERGLSEAAAEPGTSGRTVATAELPAHSERELSRAASEPDTVEFKTAAADAPAGGEQKLSEIRWAQL